MYRFFAVYLAFVSLPLGAITTLGDLPVDVQLLIAQRLNIPGIRALTGASRNQYTLLNEKISDTETLRDALIRKSLSKNRRIATGMYHTCFITRDETVECWGSLYDGQLRVPPDLKDVEDIVAGYRSTCATTKNRQTICWGGNHFIPINLSQNIGPLYSVSIGAQQICAVNQDLLGVCLRYGDKEFSVLPNLEKLRSISAGQNHICAVTIAGNVKCLGSYSDGQAISIPEDLKPAISITSGNNHNCVRERGGTVRCFGDNAQEQCNVPGDLGPVNMLVAKSTSSCALTQQGKVKCWGRPFNAPGQDPVHPITSMDVGYAYACIVMEGGVVKCDGMSNFGETAVPFKFQVPDKYN